MTDGHLICKVRFTLVQARYAEAEAICKQAIKLWEAVLGKSDVHVARGLDTLGIVLKDQVQHESTIMVMLNVISICAL